MPDFVPVPMQTHPSTHPTAIHIVSDRASGGQPACPEEWKMYRKKK
jgi:hypothetical protein